MDYVWLGLIGLVMGALAGQVLRGHYSLFADVVAGIAGGIAGGHLFRMYLTDFGSAKIGGPIFAAIGAGVLLVALRALRSVE